MEKQIVHSTEAQGATTRTPLTDALVALFDRTRPVRRAARTPLTDSFLEQWDSYNYPEEAIDHARKLETDRAGLLAALEMVRDADNDCARDFLPTIPKAARSAIDAAIAKATS